MDGNSQNFEFTTKLSSIINDGFEDAHQSDCKLVPCNSLQISRSKQKASIENIYQNSLGSCSEYNTRDHVANVSYDMDTVFDKENAIGSKLKAELSKYQKELREYTNTTKRLEEKFLKINFELSEIQAQHNNFVINHGTDNSDSHSSDSEYSLERKRTQVFHQGKSFLKLMPLDSSTAYLSSQQKDADFPKRKRRNYLRAYAANKENEPPSEGDYLKKPDKNLKDIYKALRKVMESSTPQTPEDINTFQSTIASMQTEQQRYRKIIKQQENSLQEYQTRCVKAQHVMKSQKAEIEKLNFTNHQLETDITAGIDQLQLKIEAKLKEVSQLPQMMSEAQLKHDRILKENSMLNKRIKVIQEEANQLKARVEEIGKRKLVTLTRLKTAERDLRIFKNYNLALKDEKRKLNEELHKFREQINGMQANSKRILTRQREQSEKQRRDLQRRVYELEMKLNHNQTSTTSLIRERDRLICELQSQLNSLVHNFEVSQKHIRVLRRHIYHMSTDKIPGNVRSHQALIET